MPGLLCYLLQKAFEADNSTNLSAMAISVSNILSLWLVRAVVNLIC